MYAGNYYSDGTYTSVSPYGIRVGVSVGVRIEAQVASANTSAFCLALRPRLPPHKTSEFTLMQGPKT